MLLREVLGWLRYCLQQDPFCMEAGLVAEEISSSFLSMFDENDGHRTLALYQVDKGYTPRVEVRFTGERPQVWYIHSESGESGEYMISPFSSRFPGDFRAWSRTQFVAYLIDLAKSKLCNDTQTFLTLIPAPSIDTPHTEVDALASPKISFDDVMRIVNAAINAEKKGTKLTVKNVQDWLQKNYSTINRSNNPTELAKSALYFITQGKLKAQQMQPLIDQLAKKENGGINLFNAMCNDLADPVVQRHIPPTWLTMYHDTCEQKKENAAAAVEDEIRSIVDAHSNGEEFDLGNRIAGEFGETVEASLKSTAIPVPFLSILEKADYKESIAPWSLIRRSILAYEMPKENTAKISDSVMDWLERSHLLEALYHSDEPQLKELVKRKVEAFSTKTVSNPNWVREIYDEVVGYANEHDKTKALQSEFDIWLLQALSPSVSASKVPLSPHAYNTGRSDEELYNKVFGSWLHELKKSAAERREQSIKNLSSSLDHFYKLVAEDWQKDSLEDYSPRIPSIKDIMVSAKKGDKEKLLNTLVADVENEVGVEIPKEVKASLRDSVYFNAIYKEIRFQSVKI